MDPLARIGPAPGGALDRAVSLVEAFLEICDDPEWNAIYAQLLGARGDPGFVDEASQALRP